MPLLFRFQYASSTSNVLHFSRLCSHLEFPSSLLSALILWFKSEVGKISLNTISPAAANHNQRRCASHSSLLLLPPCSGGIITGNVNYCSNNVIIQWHSGGHLPPWFNQHSGLTLIPSFFWPIVDLQVSCEPGLADDGYVSLSPARVEDDYISEM